MRVFEVFTFLVVTAAPLAGADLEVAKFYKLTFAVFYKLTFAVKEVDLGKTISSHTYFISGATGQKESAPYSIRASSKVPVAATPGSSLFTMVEVGANFDIHHMSETGSDVSLHVSADISSIMDNPVEKISYPILRQNKWQSTVCVKANKPTVIFSSDDVTGKRQMVVELTATPLP